MKPFHSNYVAVDGIRTHYLEAGEGPVVVLLHSGEFGACAELSWEHTIPALARHFRVLAPDWLGYGRTDKMFLFDGMREKRVSHIASFVEKIAGDGEACFVGNSMGGTMLLEVAAAQAPAWRMKRIVSVAGGGAIPANAGRSILNDYDGSREHMARIVRTMFVNPLIRDDESYIDRRHALSLEPGAWECTAAVRFKAPWRTQKPQSPPDYSAISVPVLIVAGGKDSLRDPDYGAVLRSQIPGSLLHVVAEAGHCPQIDAADEFNAVVSAFLAG